MTNISTIRHNDIFDPSKFDFIPIHLIGCGAIGSRIFMNLIELGINQISCYDPDIVESHNLANQAFIYRHIGGYKVQGLRDLYELKTGSHYPENMHFHTAKLPDKEFSPEGIVFLAVDSVKARQEIAESMRSKSTVFNVIEVGMGSTHGHVKTFSPSIDSEYERWWDSLPRDDGPGEVSVCGGTLSVGTTASTIANLAVWQMIHILNNPEAANWKVEIFLKPALMSAAAA